ncbi:MAG: hypothetical protein WCG55_01400 [bacterium]
MGNEEIQNTKEKVMTLQVGFLIIGGPNDQAYGTLDYPRSLFVWTDKDKAEAFLNKNLDPSEDKVLEQTREQISTFANKYYQSIRFDFQTEDPGPYLNMAVGNYLSLNN